MFSKYMNPRDTRIDQRTVPGRIRGGKLGPVMAVPFRESESGVLQQSIIAELDPIAGKMITPITFQVTAVYVPVQAAHALQNPEADYPGSSDVIRQKLLNDEVLFGLEEETELTKRLGVVPRSIGGTKKVNVINRLAHNAAVNYLRTRKFAKATKLDANSTAITPAIIGNTVLDRLNAVLDPEDRVNGAVDLAQNIQLQHNYVRRNDFETHEQSDPDGNNLDWTSAYDVYQTKGSVNAGEKLVEILDTSGSELSLLDFYRAERMDSLTRTMREMVDQNAEYGEEMVANFAHGLSIDPGKQPFVIYEKEQMLGMSAERATDGANLGKHQTNSIGMIDFAVPVPATEFGGIVVTFVSIKPDEALASQPHPVLSDVWAARNYVADELALDPMPVNIRELHADCDQVDEETTVCYIGNNHLLKRYSNYGFNRHLDPTTVEAKTAVWQLEVPMSVTPESVLYPEDLEHYPFSDQLAEVCTYTVNSMARINTPIIFGPTPVEELASIETENLFEDAVVE